MGQISQSIQRGGIQYLAMYTRLFLNYYQENMSHGYWESLQGGDLCLMDVLPSVIPV